MEFTFVTDYDIKGLTAMARGLRRTVRKRTLTGGTLEDFRTFLQEKTGKPVVKA